MMTNVVFLLPVSSQPRYHKRIRGLKRSGFSVRALYFEREYFKGSSLPCSAESLGRLVQGRYFSRVFRLVLALKRVRRELREANIVYAFGLDMAILGALATTRARVSLVYELGDIRQVQLAPGLKGRIVRALERLIVRRASAVVVTADGFLRGYLRPYLGIDPRRVHVLENRLDQPAEQRPWPRLHKPDDPIVIGYFGLLRCERSWRALQELTRIGRGAISVVVRGYLFGISLNETQENPHIKFGGEYRAPDDLPEMYAAVDLVWGCYPVPDSGALGNWVWARTNRFYEACYFRRPLVTLAGTDEAQMVQAYGIGAVLDLSDPAGAARSLYEQLMSNLQRWQRNAMAVSDAACVCSDEHEQLASRIRRSS